MEAVDVPAAPVQIGAPRTDEAGLAELEPCWRELHSHHLAVSDYRDLVEDLGVSWQRRLAWYRRLLAAGGAYLTARDADGRLVGYAMLAVENDGPDDTFESLRGVAEVVTLVVREDLRGAGVGRALLAAAESLARERGFDALKIYVMSGNARAQRFYESLGYLEAERVLYRRLAPSSQAEPPAGSPAPGQAT